MKVIITNKYHHKNQIFLENWIKHKNYSLVENIEDADLVLSPNKLIEYHKNKKYIYGPHFCVFPRKPFNIHKKNEIYIQPSQWVLDIWNNHFNCANMRQQVLQFGVDTNKFNKRIKKEKVFVYFKYRDLNHLNFIEKFLNNKNISYCIFKYGSYKEEDYLNYLKESKYGIWVGGSESQGFALQEVLSTDVPLLVWNIKYFYENSNIRKYTNLTTKVSCIPYWDERCGEYFYQKEELEETFNKFINNLDNYKPREFIMENLSMEKCYEKWDKLVAEL